MLVPYGKSFILESKICIIAKAQLYMQCFVQSSRE
ncbi:hypothetical protein HH_1605 [Helicobacter hepaticus ATCC 51449]|uniref:Uncharacterized protein n=1 Tax=Helicobacter hepaticus (strain ATCC 51449 / 3B1) TaxID=235279 RepID=Q7VFS0_HELHP|nr:hypothetical protein HH_1605 [Helicobacter hepaticus ATCC 51449]